MNPKVFNLAVCILFFIVVFLYFSSGASVFYFDFFHLLFV